MIIHEKLFRKGLISQMVVVILLHCPGHRYHKYRTGHEERKLQQLITHRLGKDVSPEVEAEETPYTADWEGNSPHTPDSQAPGFCHSVYEGF